MSSTRPVDPGETSSSSGATTAPASATSNVPARRRRPGAAAAAYTHITTITGSAEEGATLAATALRRGAHSRIAVLAHARHLAQEAGVRTESDTAQQIVAHDANHVAQQLASTRPPLERALVDLELRYGLDTASFARVLGLTPAAAQQRAQTVSASWTAELDPAMMAWLGAGTCDELGALLAHQGATATPPPSPTDLAPQPGDAGVYLAATGTDGPIASEFAVAPLTATQTVGELLALAPLVTSHAATCELCAQRLRSLTTVRTLVGQLPLEVAPASVALAARAARRRLAGPLPPSIEPRRFDLQRLQVAGTAAVVIAVIGGAAVWGGVKFTNRPESQSDRVARLVQTAQPSQLLATPTVVTARDRTAALTNNGGSAILWHATTNAAWLSVEPSDGRLAPGQTAALAIAAGETPGNAPADIPITITGSDGSEQIVHYSTGK